MTLSPQELAISLTIAGVLGGGLAFLFWKQRKEAAKLEASRPKEGTKPGSASLQLQAYERLILLADRISLPNLISRTNQPGLTVREMQAILTQSVRQEFDYNITQQIYVSQEAWDALRNLKDQNLLIINQVASYLPPEATGTDLNKSILEMLVQNPKASLHNIVSDVLSFEAKKLMK